jgi:hypothetical protein
MKNNKKLILAAVALILLVCAMGAVWFLSRPEFQQGNKDLTVKVIHGDKSEKVFEVSTDAENLGAVLVEHNIVVDNQSAYGLYILTADGETVNEANQEWWCVTKGGESLMTGADETPVADGDTFELTFTVGYGSW